MLEKEREEGGMIRAGASGLGGEGEGHSKLNEHDHLCWRERGGGGGILVGGGA